MSCYRRGDKVWWWSEHSDATKAVFVGHDPHFPKQDVILAINIGPKARPFRHEFRWPRRLTEAVDD